MSLFTFSSSETCSSRGSGSSMRSIITSWPLVSFLSLFSFDDCRCVASAEEDDRSSFPLHSLTPLNNFGSFSFRAFEAFVAIAAVSSIEARVTFLSWKAIESGWALLTVKPIDAAVAFGSFGVYSALSRITSSSLRSRLARLSSISVVAWLNINLNVNGMIDNDNEFTNLADPEFPVAHQFRCSRRCRQVLWSLHRHTSQGFQTGPWDLANLDLPTF